MKKTMTLLLMSLLVVALLVGCSSPAASETGEYTDGVHEGVGSGYNGDIKLSVVVENGYITEIEVLEMDETPGLGDAAIEKVIEAIIETQSTEVDVVSGATMSSNGTMEAAAVALGLREAAQEEVSETPEAMTFEDGIYEGVAEGYKSDIKVRVTVEGTEISSIEILEMDETPGLGDTAAEGIIESVIGFQSTEVDVVSGATASSEGTLQAIKNALANGPVQEEATEVEEEVEVTEAAPAAPAPTTPTAPAAPAPTTPAAPAPAPAPTPAPAASVYKDGAYTAKGDGFYGDIQLKVTIKDDKMTKIDIMSMDETEGIGDVAVKSVISQAISKQSGNLDTVSGATVSSKGAIDAIKKALAQAKN